jgi:hypothetical protein
VDATELVKAMTDAYIARRRKGDAFDDTAATQAFWEYAPRMSPLQGKAFADAGKGNDVAGWKIVLRDELAKREGIRRR